jgi:hypothetical protein
MKPDTSTKEKPIKDQRIRVLDRTGLRLIDSSRKLNISPTPTPTPAKEINGMLEARYRKPNNIIKPIINQKYNKLRCNIAVITHRFYVLLLYVRTNMEKHCIDLIDSDKELQLPDITTCRYHKQQPHPVTN